MYKSKAIWPAGTFDAIGNKSEDTHEEFRNAVSACEILMRDGAGGNGPKPLEVWVENEEGERYSLTEEGVKKYYELNALGHHDNTEIKNFLRAVTPSPNRKAKSYNTLMGISAALGVNMLGFRDRRRPRDMPGYHKTKEDLERMRLAELKRITKNSKKQATNTKTSSNDF